MFFTYLRRELRRRRRQAAIIALGLALSIGLVVTVTALSSGVNRAQGEVLHSLYGQDTAITVTKAPSFGSGGPGAFRFRAGGSGSRPAAGSKVSVDTLTSTGLGTIPADEVASVARLNGVAAAAGGLTLNDTKLTFTIPSQSSGGGFGGIGSGGGAPGGGFGSGHFPTPISVNGVELSGNAAALGPLSTAKLVSGRTLAASDANADVALVSSSYATSNKLTTGSTVTLAKTRFRVVGVVSAGSGNSTDVYIPLARAQALGTAQGKRLKDEVNTIYVAAGSATSITTVSKEISAKLPGTTVTNRNDLAKQLTGSVASASSLASNLGRWLAIAVLVAAFVLASLLTTAAVSRRVREFGTLKALGWPSRRIVGQVVGESLVVGMIGGAAGIALGFAGSTLVGVFAPTLTASVGQATGSATPGGARFFGGPPGGFGGGGGFAAGGFRRLPAAATPTVHVPLTATVTIGAVAAAVVLALAGGLVAGAFGGWRAGRLRPAAALARVE